MVRQMVDMDMPLPPWPDWVFDSVLLFADWVLVALFVEVELPPVSPPRAPLPPVVVEPFWMLPPLPPFPVAPELPEPADEVPEASPPGWSPPEPGYGLVHPQPDWPPP